MADEIVTPYTGPAPDGFPVYVCQPARGGGLCGCDEDDEDADCLKMHCDHL